MEWKKVTRNEQLPRPADTEERKEFGVAGSARGSRRPERDGRGKRPGRLVHHASACGCGCGVSFWASTKL